jgi:hypothetical protein
MIAAAEALAPLRIAVNDAGVGGEAEPVGHPLVAFRASDAASFMTGGSHLVGGGYAASSPWGVHE